MTVAPTRSAGPTSGEARSRRRTVLVILGMLAVLVLLTVLTREDAELEDPLDPRNPGPHGAQAVARVLEDESIEVLVVRDQESLLATRVDEDTTIAVTNPEDLGRDTVARLREHAEGAGALVVAGSASTVGELFDREPDALPTGAREAGCAEPLVDDLTVRLRGGRGLRGDGCFGAEGVSALVVDDRVTLLASAASLANQHVLEEDNAALALRLLGQHDRLVWYVADPADVGAGEGFSLTGLLPAWLVPSLYLLGASLLAVVLWRGRRLGPLVTEPLPVVVRAAEATHSRARLYRRSRDRQHAAAVLVHATHRRLVEVLGLPRNSPPEVVAGAVAARTGRDPRSVHSLLRVPPVGNDADLATLGRELADIEEEVRTP